MLIVLMKRKKSKKGKKAGKGAAKDDGDEQGVLESMPAVNWVPDSAKANAEQHKAETASIRADLDRMANETPESLAALLSSWLTKG
jgi:flagellar biosynthesis/type III secretory pathway M-ring protein FliF/YscJ